MTLAEEIAADEAELRMYEAELERKRSKSVAVENTCLALRSFFDHHPKQRAFWCSRTKRRATRKTRRAGATAGGCREWLARCIEHPGWRGVYITTTRIEAKARAWESDTRSGFVDVLRQYGTRLERPGTVEFYDLGGVIVEVREGELALQFSNGSEIELFGAKDEGAIQKLRGMAKHAFWIDEAQDFRFLEQFYKGVISGGGMDFVGEFILTGTPGRDCSGMFYEVTNEDTPLPGWEVHAFSIVDNPYFGRVIDGGYVADHLGQTHGPFDDPTAEAARIRWENTAGAYIRENSLAESDPDVQREWFARWVKEGMNYVYAVHEATTPLVYAPLRVSEAWRRYAPLVHGGIHREAAAAIGATWYDHERSCADLPKDKRRTWMFGIGCDFGTDPDPFAVVVDAFTHDLPDRFEMFSWKKTHLAPDDWRVIVALLFLQLDGACVALVGDPAGMKGELQVWRERLALPIGDADKQGKEAWIASYNGDIRRGHRHYRADSPLLDEHKHLLWLPTLPGQKRKVHKHRRLVDGRVPGDHASDASLYLSRDLAAYMHRAPATRMDRLAREEQQYERDAESVSRGRQQDDDDGWEQTRW